MLSLRLFLPESWTSDVARMDKASVPVPLREYRTKPEIAIEEIDRVIAAGVRCGCVLADAGYGLSAPFRQALSARGHCWAVGIPRHQKAYPADVQLIFPVAGRGRPRVRHVPSVKSRAAHTMLEDAKWRQVSWRKGTKGRLAARFAAVRVRIADGAPQRIGSAGAQHMPGEEVWLVGEHRSNGERITISRTCRPTPRSRFWPARSRRAGYANRPISNSRKNSAWITSRAGPGPGSTATL